MKYLSIDIEATGLAEDCAIIEFAMVPFSTTDRSIALELKKTTFVHCDSFESLRPKLDPWVIEHNETLIRRAHSEGLSHSEFKLWLKTYLESPEVKAYFGENKIVLFGKSMTAIDLPFLNRDLGWDFMRKYFHHRNLDLSGISLGLMDLNLLPSGMDSGTNLMKYLNLGDVAHTALEDAINTAKMYLMLMDKISPK
jgi:oligoribonuclease (3'-5' exoribonuclease)